MHEGRHLNQYLVSARGGLNVTEGNWECLCLSHVEDTDVVIG